MSGWSWLVWEHTETHSEVRYCGNFNTVPPDSSVYSHPDNSVDGATLLNMDVQLFGEHI